MWSSHDEQGGYRHAKKPRGRRRQYRSRRFWWLIRSLILEF